MIQATQQDGTIESIQMRVHREEQSYDLIRRAVNRIGHVHKDRRYTKIFKALKAEFECELEAEESLEAREDTVTVIMAAMCELELI